LKILPSVDTDMLDNLRAEADAADEELDREVVDLADTITQWQAHRLKLSEEKRRRRTD